MKDHIDLKGVSGAVYRYHLYRDGRPLSPMGGNFAYTREEMEGPVVVYTGETDNLLGGSRARWAQAETALKATHLYTRLNVSQSTRLREYADVTEAINPPMNKGDFHAEAD